MIKTSLPPDDLPPAEKTSTDWVLSRQLESALNQIFHQACENLEVPDRKCSLLTLLSECEWYITTSTKLTTLVVQCPTLATSWGILENIVAIAQLLEQLAIGKICVCPPSDKGTPLEVRVDEIAIYQEKFDKLPEKFYL